MFKDPYGTLARLRVGEVPKSPSDVYVDLQSTQQAVARLSRELHEVIASESIGVLAVEGVRGHGKSYAMQLFKERVLSHPKGPRPLFIYVRELPGEPHQVFKEIVKEMANELGQDGFIRLWRGGSERIKGFAFIRRWWSQGAPKGFSFLTKLLQSREEREKGVFERLFQVCGQENLAVVLTKIGYPDSRPIAWRWLTSSLTVGETRLGIGQHKIGHSIRDEEAHDLLVALFRTAMTLGGYDGICLLLDEVDTLAKLRSEAKKQLVKRFLFSLLRSDVKGLSIVLGCTDRGWAELMDGYSESIGLKRRLENNVVRLTGVGGIKETKALMEKIADLYRAVYGSDVGYVITDDLAEKIWEEEQRNTGYMVKRIMKEFDEFLPIAHIISGVGRRFAGLTDSGRGIEFQRACYSFFKLMPERFSVEGPYQKPDLILSLADDPMKRVAVECKYTKKEGSKVSANHALEFIDALETSQASSGLFFTYGYRELSAEARSILQGRRYAHVPIPTEAAFHLLLAMADMPEGWARDAAEDILEFLGFDAVIKNMTS